MKRSEMVEVIRYRLNLEKRYELSYTHMKSFTEDQAEELLYLMEEYGMLPPAYLGMQVVKRVTDVDVKARSIEIGDSTEIGLINEWEPEDD